MAIEDFTLLPLPHEKIMTKINSHGLQGVAARWICNWLLDVANRFTCTILIHETRVGLAGFKSIANALLLAYAALSLL